MAIEDIELVYNELFENSGEKFTDQELFPKLQCEMPSALQQVEIVMSSSTCI